MQAIINYLKGKKTYFFAALLLVFSISGFLTHQLTLQQAFGVLLGSGTFAALRGAIGKIEKILAIVLAILNTVQPQQPQNNPQS